MLKSKNKNKRPCDCGSGKKYKDCCGLGNRPNAIALADSRPCGDCNACCYLMGVKEFGKPYAVNCQHQCAAGCAIYKSRPPSCHHFVCMWKLSPEWGQELRPEACGIMLHADRMLDDSGIAIYVSEVWPSAFKTIPDAIVNWLANLQQSYKGQNVSVVYVRHGQQVGTDYKTADLYKDRDTEGHLTPASTHDHVNYVLLTPATPTN